MIKIRGRITEVSPCFKNDNDEMVISNDRVVIVIEAGGKQFTGGRDMETSGQLRMEVPFALIKTTPLGQLFEISILPIDQ